MEDEFANGEEPKKKKKIIIEDKRFDREEIFSDTPVEHEHKEAVAEQTEKDADDKDRLEEEQSKVDAQAQAQTEVKKTAEETGSTHSAQAEGAKEQFKAVSVFQLGIDEYLKHSLGIYLNFAYIYMGLMPNPETGILTPDLAKAKLSIDTFEFAFEKVKPSLNKQEQAELTRVLRDLKMNFLNIASSPPKQPGGGKNQG